MIKYLSILAMVLIKFIQPLKPYRIRFLLIAVIIIFCHEHNFAFALVEGGTFLEGPSSLPQILQQQRTARAEVRQIASIRFQKYDELSKSDQYSRSDVKKLQGTEKRMTSRSNDNLRHFNIENNTDSRINENEGPVPTFFSEKDEDYDPIPIINIQIKTSEAEDEKIGSSSRPRSIRSGSRSPKRSKKKPKDSEEEEDDDDEIEPDIVSNPGVFDHNKPDKPKKNGSNSPKRSGKVIFEENFTDRGWDSKWIYPKQNGNGSKKFEKFFRVRSKPKRSGKPLDYGIMTSNKGTEDYAIATTFTPLNSNDASLAIQFSVQYQTKPYCEYAYVRLFDCRFRPEDFSPDTPFLIQLGPNICGVQTNELSVEMFDPIKSERGVINDKIEAVTSTYLHTYTLIIDPESNFKILTNDTEIQNGTLKDKFKHYQGFPSICSVGLRVWHSVLDKFFKGQIILDDILISTDVEYAEKRRMEILNMPGSASSGGSKEKDDSEN